MKTQEEIIEEKPNNGKLINVILLIVTFGSALAALVLWILLYNSISNPLLTMNTIQPDTTAQPGDYYGTVYKGSFLIPLVGIIILVVAIIVRLRRRK